MMLPQFHWSISPSLLVSATVSIALLDLLTYTSLHLTCFVFSQVLFNSHHIPSGSERWQLKIAINGVLMGKSSMNDGFSIAMFDETRGYLALKYHIKDGSTLLVVRQLFRGPPL